MFNYKCILACLALASSASATALSAAAAASIATAAAVDSRAVQASPTVTLCTNVNFGGTCITLDVVSDECVSFTGGFSILNNEVSSAVIPGGFACTFFSNVGCTSSPENYDATLTGGSWPNFMYVPNNAGFSGYNDEASSFSCSPLLGGVVGSPAAIDTCNSG